LVVLDGSREAAKLGALRAAKQRGLSHARADMLTIAMDPSARRGL
jgi:hypothetical protein